MVTLRDRKRTEAPLLKASSTKDGKRSSTPYPYSLAFYHYWRIRVNKIQSIIGRIGECESGRSNENCRRGGGTHVWTRTRCDQDNLVNVIVAQTASTQAEGDIISLLPSLHSSSFQLQCPRIMKKPPGTARALVLIAFPGIIRTREIRTQRIVRATSLRRKLSTFRLFDPDLSSSTKFRLIRGAIFVRSACAHRFLYDCFNTGGMSFLREMNGWLIERKKEREGRLITEITDYSINII